nr:MAG TPA: hypothetical protein [Caudoviricetes sp.]
MKKCKYGYILACSLILILFLVGCRTKRSVTTEQSRVVLDNSVAWSIQQTMDSLLRVQSSIIESVKNYRVFAMDSSLRERNVDRTTVITLDSEGKEIARETNTVVNNTIERHHNKETETENDTNKQISINEVDKSKQTHNSGLNTTHDEKLNDKEKTKENTESALLPVLNFVTKICLLVLVILLLFKFDPNGKTKKK